MTRIAVGRHIYGLAAVAEQFFTVFPGAVGTQQRLYRYIGENSKQCRSVSSKQYRIHIQCA